MIRAALGILHYLSPDLETAPYEDMMELLTHLPKDLDGDAIFAEIEKVPTLFFSSSENLFADQSPEGILRRNSQ